MPCDTVGIGSVKNIYYEGTIFPVINATIYKCDFGYHKNVSFHTNITSTVAVFLKYHFLGNNMLFPRDLLLPCQVTTQVCTLNSYDYKFFKTINDDV